MGGQTVKKCVNSSANLISTKVNASQRKSTQVYASQRRCAQVLAKRLRK